MKMKKQSTAAQLLQQQQQQQQQLLLQQQEKQKQHLRQQLEAVNAITTTNNNNTHSSFPIAYVDIVSNQHEQEISKEDNLYGSFGIVATEEEFEITNRRSNENKKGGGVVVSSNNTEWNTNNNNWLIGGCCGVGGNESLLDFTFPWGSHTSRSQHSRSYSSGSSDDYDSYSGIRTVEVILKDWKNKKNKNSKEKKEQRQLSVIRDAWARSTGSFERTPSGNTKKMKGGITKSNRESIIMDTSDWDEEQRNKKTSKKKKKSTKRTNQLMDQTLEEQQVGGGSMTHQYEAKLERMVEEHELEIKKLKSDLIKTQLGSSPTCVASSNVIFDSNVVAIGSVVGSSGGGGGGFSVFKKPFKNLGSPTTAAGGGGGINNRKPFSDASTILHCNKVRNETVPTTVTTAALNHMNKNNHRATMNDMRRTTGQHSSRRGQSSQPATISTCNKSQFSSASSVISMVTNPKSIISLKYYIHMKEETATMKKAWALSSGPTMYRSTN